MRTFKLSLLSLSCLALLGACSAQADQEQQQGQQHPGQQHQGQVQGPGRGPGHGPRQGRDPDKTEEAHYSLKTVSYVPVAGDDESTQDNAHLMDIYIPSGIKKPMPVILWIHGGAWILGSKEDTPALYFMKKDGFAVCSINYRFSNEGKFPAQIEDVKAAVRFIRANAKKYGFDPNRIAAFGNSAGGHLSALLGTTGDIKSMEGDLGNNGESSKVQCVVDWCGPTDFLSIKDQGGADNKLRLDDMRGPVARLFGGLPEQKQELAKSASPVNFVSPDDPPFLIMHGDHDQVVPIQQSKQFYEALKAANVKVIYQVVKNGEHNFFSPETLGMVEIFLKNNLH